MNILFVYDCIYPESLGGVEHRNYCLAKALAALGHKVTLAGWVRAPESPCEGVTVLPMAFRTKLYDPAGKRTVLTSLKFALATLRLDLRDYDVVESANIPYLHLLPLTLLCLWRNKPLVVTWHEYFGPLWRDYKQGAGAALFMAMEWFCAQLGDAVSGVSAMTAERLARHRLRKAPIPVIPNGVALERIRAVAPQPDAAALLYAGRLMREKRLELVLRALAERDMPPLRLTIIGDGPDRTRLEALTRELNLAAQVRFLGRLPESDAMWRHLAAAQIAVQPSAREGFGMFALEAMALGVPVLYCESPDNAMRDVVRDGMEGLCVAATPQAVAAGLRKLLQDPELRLSLGRNAKARAEDYDWNSIAGQIANLFVAARRG